MTKKELNENRIIVNAFEKLGYSSDDLTICKNCECVVPIDCMGESELAIQDHVCKDCMEEGYGK